MSSARRISKKLSSRRKSKRRSRKVSSTEFAQTMAAIFEAPPPTLRSAGHPMASWDPGAPTLRHPFARWEPAAITRRSGA
jgi:hypothetical protein